MRHIGTMFGGMSSAPESILLVANPTAQSGKNADRIGRGRALLDERGLRHRFKPTEPAGGTVEVVRSALADPDIHTVVYMGGDGTFAEVAKGILASGRADEVRLGMLPTGTANDQGKSFGLESLEEHLERNIEVIAAGREARLDAGRLDALDAGGRLLHRDHFFDSAGWGISPAILAVRNDDRELIQSIPILRDIYRDQLVYVGAMFRTFLKTYIEDGKFGVRLRADGAEHHWTGLTDLVVKGTRIYGGLWVFDPESRPDDGLFEIFPFAGKRDWVSKALVHLDPTGNVKDKLESIGVRHSEGAKGAKIELEFEEQPGQPLHAQIDGEEFPASPMVRIEVLPRALRLIVPAEFATDSG